MENNGNINNSRKVAYSAVAVALSLTMIALSTYVPIFSVAPLVIVSLSWNIVMEKCGLGYGIASMLATIALGFLVSIGAGFSIMIVVGVAFVPYSLVAFFMRNIDYSKSYGIIRAIVLLVVASLSFLAMFLLTEAVLGYIDIMEIISTIFADNIVIGYIVLNVASAIAFIIIDLIYLNMRKYILAKLR